MNSICLHCDEEILPHEMIPDAEGKVHRECLLRSIVGSVGHQMGRCSCFGYRGNGDDESLTRRENALIAARFFDITQAKAAKAKFN